MALTSTSLSFIALALVLLAWLWIRKNKDKKLPPGPRGLPIFGSLHLLGKFPHRALHQLAKKYGPIMHLQLGLVPTIVVSSPKAAEFFLRIHDLNFASRPPHEAAKYMSYKQKNLSFASYGSYWRNVRKMCTLELLSNLKINSFKSMRKEELELLIEYIKAASRQRVSVDLSAKVSSLSADMSCRMVFGKEFDERGFKAVIQEAMMLAAAPNLGDYIPQIAALDLQAMLACSMDTSAAAIEWALSELIKHPRTMKKVQKELEKVGKERMAEESDLESLECLEMRAGLSASPIRVRPKGLPWNSTGNYCGSIGAGAAGALLRFPNDPQPTDLDIAEEFSLVTPRARHLEAPPTYRLHI
ncbi:hypothetical protein GH714_019274 [Hevea brasiliensis]|uniref:Cytochrome P450 n=1 Tax=Hevea brasiliensis TaxID=3981 RepID=A0A6A6K7R7_HEVBR|nr:hypothetical protein GH714_019274 [Hevea brasiliensis]